MAASQLLGRKMVGVSDLGRNESSKLKTTRLTPSGCREGLQAIDSGDIESPLSMLQFSLRQTNRDSYSFVSLQEQTEGGERMFE